MSLSRDIALALDASAFARACGIQPDEWQATLLQSRPKRALLCCCRQSGKTTVTALLALHTALYTSSALVVIVSPSQRQSAEMLRSIKNYYEAFSEGDTPTLEIASESVLRVELRNKSRIIALPGTEKTVRGLAGVELVVIDEAAAVEGSLIVATRPMVAVSGGSIIALSTPRGRRGWFFEAWSGSGKWHRVRVPASECPRISAEFLQEELQELGPAMFAQEYELEFVDDVSAAFNSAIVDRCFSPEVQPLWE